MTAQIICPDGVEAHDLIYPDCLSMLSTIEQDTMKRALMNSSRVWIGMDDDKIIATWGLIAPTLMSDTAYLWLLTTKHLTSHQFMFIRHSKRVVEQMLDLFPTIVGHTAVANIRGQQWLRWLGAEFSPSADDTPFVTFTIRARQWQQDSVQSA
jgi:hypothetical protein